MLDILYAAILSGAIGAAMIWALVTTADDDYRTTPTSFDPKWTAKDDEVAYLEYLMELA
jgi:hypothetical protein